VFIGLIARIHPAVDPVTRTATVEVRLKNERNATGNGCYAPASMQKAISFWIVRRDTLTLPADVALRRGTRFIAFVVNDGKAQTRELRVGVRAATGWKSWRGFRRVNKSWSWDSTA
jgi:hypothetical protein